MRPDFSEIAHDSSTKNNGRSSLPDTQSAWQTPEKIDIPPAFSPDDIKELNHLDFAAGIPPYLRGPYSTMYALRPWTIRNMRGFRPLKNPTPFTGAIWRRAKKGYP